VEAVEATDGVVNELQAPEPDRGRIQRLWGVIQVASTGNEALMLVHEIARAISHLGL
jgi:hypothetical protein